MLLGDTVELRHGPAREALEEAAPVLGALGSGVEEVVIVPGNHDHGLLRPWLARRSLDSAAPLGLESEITFGEDELLGQLAAALSPASVRATYPGLWARPDVYAIHGHYGDRHITVPIMERLGAGVMTKVVREPAGGPRAAEDYEATLGPMYAWIDAVAQTFGSDRSFGMGGFQVHAWRALTASSGGGRPARVRRAGLRLGFPAVVAALNRAGFGPLGTALSGPELRRAALRGFGEVLARLSVAAEHVVFGHTHRAGPLPADDATEWVAPTGSEMVNSGSWVNERGVLGPNPSESPYRPGFGVEIGEYGPPVLRNLLD